MKLGWQLPHEVELLAHVHFVVVVERLSQLPLELEVQLVFVAEMGEHPQLVKEQLRLAVRGTHDVGEGTDCHRVSNHPNYHQNYAEDLLGWVLARDVAVAHCRDCRHDKVETGEILLGSARFQVLVADHPSREIEVLELRHQEPQTAQRVAQDSEDEEKEEQRLEFDAVHRGASDLSAD